MWKRHVTQTRRRVVDFVDPFGKFDDLLDDCSAPPPSHDSCFEPFCDRNSNLPSHLEEIREDFVSSAVERMKSGAKRME